MSETVPCYECGKELKTGTFADGAQVIIYDGRSVNMCHRCGMKAMGYDIDAGDEVLGKSK